MAEAEPFVVMAKPAGPVCNLDCRYCYYLDKSALFGARRRLRMSTDVLDAYVASFIAASPGPLVHFVWHGGEPTLAGIDFFREALESQRRHLPPGWRAINNLQTNATLLDEAWCEVLAEHRFAVGVSIDGPARLHDAHRVARGGAPTHDRVMRGLGLLRAAGIEPDILCTLNALTAAEPLEVYRFFVEQGVRWLAFLPVVERAGDGGVSERSLTGEAMGAFLCTVFDEWVRHDVARLAVQNFLECLLVLAGQPANLCTMAERCGRALAVEHDGSVYSCDHFVDTEHRLGDVAGEGLAALLRSSAQRAFADAKRELLPACCKDCAVGQLCHGGCPKDRFAQTAAGEPHLNHLCAGYFRFYGHATPYLERMVALDRDGRSPAAIMEELAFAERGAQERWRDAGRNDPCPCGSGLKYKHCCLAQRRR